MEDGRTFENIHDEIVIVHDLDFKPKQLKNLKLNFSFYVRQANTQSIQEKHDEGQHMGLWPSK